MRDSTFGRQVVDGCSSSHGSYRVRTALLRAWAGWPANTLCRHEERGGWAVHNTAAAFLTKHKYGTYRMLSTCEVNVRQPTVT